MFWRSKGDDIIVVEHLNPDKTTVARAFKSAKFLYLVILISQKRLFDLSPTAVRQRSLSSHSSVWRRPVPPIPLAPVTPQA